jgi:hypothetical protein
MIDQIRYLQSRQPFETFALELTTGRVIQINERHMVATVEGAQYVDGAVGVLHEKGSFEVISVGHIVNVSAGVHRKVKDELEARKEDVRKTFE